MAVLPRDTALSACPVFKGFLFPPPVKIDPSSMYPMEMNSDSEDSGAEESSSAPFQDLQRE